MTDAQTWATEHFKKVWEGLPDASELSQIPEYTPPVGPLRNWEEMKMYWG